MKCTPPIPNLRLPFVENVRKGIAGVLVLAASLVPLCATASEPAPATAFVPPPSRTPPASPIHFSRWKRFVVRGRHPRLVVWGYVARQLFPHPDDRQKVLIQNAIDRFRRSPGKTVFGLIGTPLDNGTLEIFFDPSALNRMASMLRAGVEFSGSPILPPPEHNGRKRRSSETTSGGGTSPLRPR